MTKWLRQFWQWLNRFVCCIGDNSPATKTTEERKISVILRIGKQSRWIEVKGSEIIPSPKEARLDMRLRKKDKGKLSFFVLFEEDDAICMASVYSTCLRDKPTHFEYVQFHSSLMDGYDFGHEGVPEYPAHLSERHYTLRHPTEAQLDSLTAKIFGHSETKAFRITKRMILKHAAESDFHTTDDMTSRINERWLTEIKRQK